MGIEIKAKFLPDLRKFVKEVDRYEKSYLLNKTTTSNDLVRMDMWFTHVGSRRKKSLCRTLESKHAKIIATYSEDSDRLTLKTKKSLRNSAIYFAIAYFTSLAGTSLVSSSTEISLEKIHMLFIALFPGFGSFFTRLALELKI